jgi:hypothetical protein
MVRQQMRFIAALLGLSPDNNSGATEAAILLAFVLAMTAVWYFDRFKRSKKQRTIH